MSAVMSDQSNTNVAEFFSPGPGERLRAALRPSTGGRSQTFCGDYGLAVIDGVLGSDFRC